MPTDMKLWFGLVKDQVDSLADEEYLRSLWFGLGPGIDWPDERFNKFFDDASVEEFLERVDTGLNDEQLASLRKLTLLMRTLSDETEDFLPPTFIDDPRWQAVMAAAQETKKLLDQKE